MKLSSEANRRSYLIFLGTICPNLSNLRTGRRIYRCENVTRNPALGSSYTRSIYGHSKHAIPVPAVRPPVYWREVNESTARLGVWWGIWLHHYSNQTSIIPRWPMRHGKMDRRKEQGRPDRLWFWKTDHRCLAHAIMLLDARTVSCAQTTLHISPSIILLSNIYILTPLTLR